MIIGIKVGSNVLSTEEGDLDLGFLSSLAKDIKHLSKEFSFFIVSSGAVMVGTKKLGLSNTSKKTLIDRQIFASIGQSVLMGIYDNIFSNYGLRVGQVLLTTDIFENKNRFATASNTLKEMINRKIVPIINENDAVATEELIFGDNDFLSVFVSYMVYAKKLIIISSSNGLLDDNGNVIREIENVDDFFKYIKPSKSSFGSGGMKSKLEAAKIASLLGIDTYLSSKNISIIDILRGTNVFTHIKSFKNPIKNIKKVLSLATRPKGIIYVDKGAKEALLKRKSLLAVGVRYFEGTFEKGDIVNIVFESDKENSLIAKGRVNISSVDLSKKIGIKDIEVIHADNIVLL